jgi:hypothetical protein
MNLVVAPLHVPDGSRGMDVGAARHAVDADLIRVVVLDVILRKKLIIMDFFIVIIQLEAFQTKRNVEVHTTVLSYNYFSLLFILPELVDSFLD